MSLIAGQLLGFIRLPGMAVPPARIRTGLTDAGTIRFCRAHGLPLGRVRPVF